MLKEFFTADAQRLRRVSLSFPGVSLRLLRVSAVKALLFVNYLKFVEIVLVQSNNPKKIRGQKMFIQKNSQNKTN